MSERARRALLSGLFTALAFVACAEPQRPRNEGYVDRVCNTICQKRVQCDAKWDAAICQKNCRERGSPARAFWREDYVKETLACLDGAGCDVLGTGETTEKKCFRETRPQPSESAKRFCEVALEKDRACTGLPPNVPRCLRTWGMINDAVLKDLIECQDRPCGKAARCAKAIVGFDKTEDD